MWKLAIYACLAEAVRGLACRSDRLSACWAGFRPRTEHSALCVWSVWCQVLVPGAGKRWYWRWGKAEEEESWDTVGVCPGELGRSQELRKTCWRHVRSFPALYFPLPQWVNEHHRQLFGEGTACGVGQVSIQRVLVQQARQAVAELAGGGLLVRCSLLLWRPESESPKLASSPLALRWLDSQNPRAVGVYWSTCRCHADAAAEWEEGRDLYPKTAGASQLFNHIWSQFILCRVGVMLSGLTRRRRNPLIILTEPFLMWSYRESPMDKPKRRWISCIQARI